MTIKVPKNSGKGQKGSFLRVNISSLRWEYDVLGGGRWAFCLMGRYSMGSTRKKAIFHFITDFYKLYKRNGK